MTATPPTAAGRGAPGARRDEARRLAAELLGTGFLLAAIVGSGIVTEVEGSGPTQLFQHAVVVGVTLAALIATFGPVSGAHFNPVVTLADAWFGGMPWRRVPGYLVAQLVGACLGVMVTTASFGLGAVTIGTVPRAGLGLAAGELVATLGLLLVIFGVVRSGGGRAVAAAVGAYITGAILFTSSAAFANPAVTVARALSDTFTAIAPASVPGFLAGQAVGLAVALVVIAFVFEPTPAEAAAVVVPVTDPAASTPAPSGSMDALDPAGRSRAHAPTGGSLVPDRPTVLFLCVHNAGRSQMAAGWLTHLAGDAVEVFSGGSAPAASVNPAAVAAMAEVGIDISSRSPQPWTDEMVGAADVVVSMGCGDTCPVLPGKRYLDWELPDPAGQGVAAVRPIRDEIERRVRRLLVDLVPASG